MLFASKYLLSDFRLAVVMGIYISDQVGPCHSEFLNDFRSVIHCFAASKHFGDFVSNFFISVRMFLALISLCLH